MSHLRYLVVFGGNFIRGHTSLQRNYHACQEKVGIWPARDESRADGFRYTSYVGDRDLRYVSALREDVRIRSDVSILMETLAVDIQYDVKIKACEIQNTELSD